MKIIKPRFIHLHVHSDYSMCDGLAKINELIEQAKLLNMPALALTDFNNLFGCIKFYNYAYKIGIKPIIGADLLIQDNICDKKLNKVTLLVMNTQGYHHLIILISKAHQYKYNNVIPVIQRRWLEKYNKGLIILSGAHNGDIGWCLLNDKKIQLEKYLYFYTKYFKDRYYLELIRSKRQYEDYYIQLALELSQIKGLPVVATNDVCFINKKDFKTHEIRVSIHDGIILNKSVKSYKYSPQQFMKNEQEMCELFSDIPESLINSVEIAYRCNIHMDLNKSCFLPKFNTGLISDKDFLIMQAKMGLEERLILLFPEIKKRNVQRKSYDLRLKNELCVINQMGFPSYFLIVMEFIQWAKNNNIPVGPGRGSGASSLVAYALKITELDPLKFDLLFERFLNPERISMPDLDIDFCVEHRDLVIKHVAETYGMDSVSQIITFGTMTAKAVIRDVGRVLGLPYVFVNRIAKLIPSEPGMTLKKAFSDESQLNILYRNNEDITILIDTARKLEGIIKNVSKHAGGIVISPTKIINFAPLYYDSDNICPMTQFDKDDIECIGLIKFDFLGLRTLTIIDRSLKMINQKRLRYKLPAININSISLCDQKSFQMLQTGKTTAVFQLESKGIQKLIKRLKPDQFEDLVAVVALFRPGPLQSGMVDNFINRKHGYEIISYPDPKWQHKDLYPVLKSTYGIILYQEQVMQIAQVLAGYTLGNADILRRAIGKKKSEDMANQRSVFNIGAQSNNIDSMLATKIFDLVEKFAGYGFNKSHSAAYALISYQTLWLKTHYPAEFMAAALSSDMDNSKKIIYLINECKRMQLVVLPPDINNSQYYFYVNKDQAIVYGMGAIKGIGKNSIEAIIVSRNNNGNFTELFDFCARIDNTKINYRMIGNLISSGAFDTFGMYRSQLMVSLDGIIKNANQYIQKKYDKQMDMFAICINTYKTVFSISNNCCSIPQWSNQKLLKKEKEALGLYLTGHPMIQYFEEIKNYIHNILEIKNIKFKKYNEKIYVFGLIISIRIKLNIKNNHIMICIVEDHSGRLEVIISSKLIKECQYCLKENNIIFITGTINFDKTKKYYKIIAQELQEINDIRKKYVHSLCIVLRNKQINNNFLDKIRFYLQEYQYGGILPVYFYYQKNDIQVNLRCGKKWCIIPTNQLLENLRNLVGDEQVILKSC